MLEDAPAGAAIRSAGLFSLAGVESSGFHAVAADFHVASAAGLVLAGVQEEPAAGLAGAALELQGPLREQEIYRCLREQPHGSHHLAVEAAPAPDGSKSLGGERAVKIGLLKVVFKRAQA